MKSIKQVTEDVWVHESDTIQSNATVMQGKAGVLLIDPGLTNDEMEAISDDLNEMGQPVIAGFSTHPHWDHVLWHPKFGKVPRYGTARCAAEIQTVLSNSGWKDDVAGELPEEVAGDVPLDDLFGRITGLPANTTHVPLDGPEVRIIEHQAHAPGHAALLIEERRVLATGDMLSDVLVPMLNLAAANPIGDYLAALQLLEGVTDNVDIVIPGHGSVGEGDELRKRIKQDRAYVEALREGKTPDDPRINSPKKGWEWVASVHGWQAKTLAEQSKHVKKSE
jgi:glyoxylase-like metal-dependent hydrolase (beta-lactamase superfamily II)